MINFYLPDTMHLRTLNYMLLHTMKNRPEMFIDCKIAGLYGVLIPTVFAGGRIHMPEYLTESAIRCFLDYCRQNDLEYRFTFTNSKLTEAHLSDTFGNLQLRLAEEYDCPVIVASPLLESYIRSNYPKIRLIVSITTLKSFEDIQKSLSSDDYYCTVVNVDYNNELDKIDKSLRSKAEILVWDCCPPMCPHKANCYANICNMNIGVENNTYSIVHGNIVSNNANMCLRPEREQIMRITLHNPAIAHTELNKFCKNLTQEEVKKLNELGYESFKVGGRESGGFQAILIYADYLPKVEYQDEFIGIMLNYLSM